MLGVLWEARRVVQGSVEALGSLCAAGDCVTERDTDSLCPQAPGHQGNAAKLAPMAGRSLSAFQTLLFWIFMRVRGENLVLDFTKC